VLDTIKPNTTTLDLLTWVASMLPQRNGTEMPTTFNQLIPTVNLSKIVKLPDLPPVMVPAFNVTLPSDLINVTALDPSTLLSNLTGPNGEGVSAVLRGLAGDDTGSGLFAIADFLDAVRGGTNPALGLQQLMSKLPQNIATPTGFADWLTTLVPNNSDGTNPLGVRRGAINGWWGETGGNQWMVGGGRCLAQ
jgi:hypothetical protein